jgi:P-type Ca2+ transporter type 2C
VLGVSEARESGAATASPTWHALAAGEVVARLDSDEKAGLGSAEAKRRLGRYGHNELRVERPRPWWRILFDQFRSVVVALLLLAAVGAALFGDHLEAAAIGAVLLINVAIGFGMEWRARVAMDALRRIQVAEARVVRGGVEAAIDARLVVPGDVVVLEAGVSVPADARLLEAAELRVVEAPLTGESVPVTKSVEPVEAPSGDGEVPLAERGSMLYKGTLVVAGSARAVVVGTGGDTELGRIGELVASTERERTPLEQRLDALGRWLVVLTLGMAAALVGLGLLRGREPWLMIQTALALAVAAVPEGLPAIATIMLALGMRRMARRRALVRRLAAVETLGSVTVICTDKTGTLTTGEMTAERLWIAPDHEYRFTGSGYQSHGEVQLEGESVDAGVDHELRAALVIGALVNNAHLGKDATGAASIAGDPMEAALLVAARKGGLDREGLLAERPEIAEIPFSSERLLMGTVHRTPEGGRELLVKGAPGAVVDLCARVVTATGTTELDDTARQDLLEHNRRLAGQGLRVLAVARRDLDAAAAADASAIGDLDFVGFVGLVDPLARGVSEAIARLHTAGIEVVMITGDQLPTAEAIGRELGLLRDDREGIEGRELAGLGQEELGARAGTIAVYARTSPADKLRIVRALEDRGEIVGMLGDGINDTPALKRAAIGVAMGRRGTDAARETADLVLLDDRFETVTAAVEEGRVIFDNLRKFVFYLFSCNLAEVLVLVGAGLTSLPLPLLPLQILWLNLVTDVFPAMALAVEPAEPDVMRRPPRSPQEGILSRRFLVLIAAHAALITVATLGAFLWALRGEGANDPARAVTIAFMALALGQIAHVLNARGDRPVLFGRRLLQNRWVSAAILFTLALQLAAVYLPPLAVVLGTVPLGWSDWLLVLAAALLPLLAGQLWRACFSREKRRGSSSP